MIGILWWMFGLVVGFGVIGVGGLGGGCSMCSGLMLILELVSCGVGVVLFYE